MSENGNIKEIDMIHKIQNIYSKCIAGDITIETAMREITSIQCMRYRQLPKMSESIFENDSVLQITSVFISMLNKRMVSNIMGNVYNIDGKEIPAYIIDYYVNHIISRYKLQDSTNIEENETRRKVLHDNILRCANEERGSKWSKSLQLFLDNLIFEKM